MTPDRSTRFTALFDTLLDDGRLALTLRQVHRRLRSALDYADFSQEVLLRCWGRRHAFRGTSAEELLAWVRRIAFSIYVDWIRYEAARRRRQTRLLVKSELERLPDTHQSGDTAAAVERAHDARAILARVEKEEREVLICHYFGGQSFREIAAILKRPYHVVTRLHARALRRIRDAGWLGITLLASCLP